MYYITKDMLFFSRVTLESKPLRDKLKKLKKKSVEKNNKNGKFNVTLMNFWSLMNLYLGKTTI